MTEHTPIIRCKVRASEPVRHMGNDEVQFGETVQFFAVVGHEGSENASWSKATPSAQFNLYISNPAAFGKVVGGDEYYVDFIPASAGS